MSHRERVLRRIRSLLGRSVRFGDAAYRLIEVFDDPPKIVLAPLAPVSTIVADSYGHPAGKGPGFLELPVFDEAGRLNEDVARLAVTIDED